jgi:hypothetical protein
MRKRLDKHRKMTEQNKILGKIPNKRLGKAYKWYIQKRKTGDYKQNRTIGYKKSKPRCYCHMKWTNHCLKERLVQLLREKKMK